MEKVTLQLSEQYNNVTQQAQSDPMLLLFIVGIPLLYVIICSIVGKSNENRAFFYSYTDVSLAYLVPIVVLGLSFVKDISNDTKLFICLGVFIFVAIWMFVISYRANQRHICVALFTWSGKIVFIFLTVILFIAAIFLAVLGIILALFIKDLSGRQKYERKIKYKTKEARYAGAGLGFGFGMICAITTFGVKYHNFSLPAKLASKEQVDLEETENAE